MGEEWLAVVFPALAAELWNVDGRWPGVWIADARQRVWQMDVGAARRGVQLGMSAAQARALAPELQTVRRDPEQESNLLDRCAQLLYAWGPKVVALQEWPHVLAVELRGNRHWQTHPQRLLQALQDFAGEYLRYQLGLAPTPLAAALLAWQGQAGTLARCPPGVDFTECWQQIPLALLPANAASLARWHSLGLRSCRDWSALDRRERALRFGADWESFFDRLRGIRPDPRPAWPWQEEWLVSFPLLQEVTDWQGLRFPLRRAFQELRLRLQQRACSRWELLLQGRDEQYRALLQSRDPLTSADFFLQLWQERLQRQPWQFAARQLQLRALEAQDWGGEQQTFWEQGLLHRQGRWLDLWRARLGAENVYQLRLRAEHRPELAWQRDSSGQYCAPNPSLPAFSCPRPLWLLPQAQAIPSLAIVLDPSTCERVEGGWWDGNDIARDYFRWRRADGAQCWVFRDCRSGRYFLHGYFA
ncbi:hypothetical protein [Candidatus Igneacidithiobacillus taiwanensis]|uniref:Y-family DNA polymerase n=1 Tax=Candidatus Igneacidithiobacillus taiwanensis TaxID=1945924 RepID=UPI0028969420|nr:hypothetical protein [Candidatus Igneacidithiobacillus taiwanensis]MCE5359862.1 hypothetical protein [Acidithiobacillus sp.]